MEGQSHTRAVRFALPLMCIVVFAASCGAPERGESEADVDVAEEAEEREATEPLRGDQRLERHMQRMSTVPPDSLVLVMPMHLEELGAVLEEFEPMSMGMQADTVWRLTLDSVQNDLARMRDMGAGELRAFMPEHSRRVDRLIFLHDSAMGSER